MAVKYCIPVIPRADLQKSLCLWVDGLGFSMTSEMRKDDKLINCMLEKGNLYFMLNQRAGNPIKPEDYNGISLYLDADGYTQNQRAIEEPGTRVSKLEDRDYGQTEFFLTDDDGSTHCFGVATRK